MIDPAIKPFCVRPHSLLRDVIACIDRNEKGIALVTDDDGHLLGTITDGDMRRGILAGLAPDAELEVLLQRRKAEFAKPITAPAGTDRARLLEIMRESQVRQIPLLDDDSRVVGLVTTDELMPEHVLPLRAVIMAGGRGQRLYPLTETTPKPMLPVGDRPLMEHTIRHLRDAGIKNVSITTHYRPEEISKHFRDGHDFGVAVEYVRENEPLGTAGSLALLRKSGEPLLVINGDVLTRVDFKAMLAYHRDHKADMTVGVRKYDLNVPYGVIQCDDIEVREVVEKPMYSFLVNAGIYLIEPSVCDVVPLDRRFDMTDLIGVLVSQRRKVISFPILEYWLDVGRPKDYQQAQKDIQQWEKNP
ncbi:MAG: nucleotidyltransferase family protein [Verrucomicrobiota bacterium]